MESERIKIMNNLVSIIIPSYGGADYLKRCIDSALGQTYKNIEIIVVDDNGAGSEGQLKTAAVMSQYKEDERVVYVCHPVNKNGSAARNTGVKIAKGDYISVFDDDDELYPNFVEEHMKVLPTLPKNYALTYCGFDVLNSDKKKIRVNEANFTGQDLYSLFLHRVEIGSSTMLIKKSVYLELNGFDESFRRHQDWEFTVRVMSKYKVKALPIIGYARYLENRNIPRSTEKSLEYRRFYLEKMKPYIALLPKRKQKDVIVYNLLNACLDYLFIEKNYSSFIKEYFRIKPGYRGVLFLMRSMRNRLTTLFKGVLLKRNHIQ